MERAPLVPKVFEWLRGEPPSTCGSPLLFRGRSPRGRDPLALRQLYELLATVRRAFAVDARDVGVDRSLGNAQLVAYGRRAVPAQQPHKNLTFPLRKPVALNNRARPGIYQVVEGCPGFGSKGFSPMASLAPGPNGTPKDPTTTNRTTAPKSTYTNSP